MSWEERRRRKNNSPLQRERSIFTRISNLEPYLTSQLTRMEQYQKLRDCVSPENAKEKVFSWLTIRTESIVETVILLWLKKKRPKLLAKNNNENITYLFFRFKGNLFNILSTENYFFVNL